MIEFDILTFFVTLTAGFLGGIVIRAWRARELTSFRPLLPSVPRPSQLPRPRAPHVLTPSLAITPGLPPQANEFFIPLPRQVQHEPGAPCFVCGGPLDEADHANCG